MIFGMHLHLLGFTPSPWAKFTSPNYQRIIHYGIHNNEIKSTFKLNLQVQI